MARLQQYLCESLKLRILNVPISPGLDRDCKVRIAILFSGGLDCTVLARIAHDLLPIEQEIDLINVGFENPRVVEAAKKILSSKKRTLTNIRENTQPESKISFFETCPDRETGRKAFKELQNVCHHRVWRFVAVNFLFFITFFVSLPRLGQRSLRRNNSTQSYCGWAYSATQHGNGSLNCLCFVFCFSRGRSCDK